MMMLRTQSIDTIQTAKLIAYQNCHTRIFLIDNCPYSAIDDSHQKIELNSFGPSLLTDGC